jgi:hypothetical protein
MTANIRSLMIAVLYISLTAGLAVTAGCASGSYAAKGAGEGATTGAVAGAVGGMVTALVFGGDVVEAGARGAVYGGTTGAVVGGMSGSKADQAVAAQKQAESEADLEKLRTRIGPDAFNGVAALAECKHEVAIANAREATKSKKSDYALAGMWVLVLAEADRQNESEARALYPDIVKHDRNFKTEADVEAGVREALQELGNIRVEYDMPAVCVP